MIVLFVGGAVVLGWLWLLGTANQGRTAQLGLRSARQIAEEREALAAEDLDQLLQAHNARRRARGLADETAEDVLRQAAADGARRSTPPRS